MVVVVVAAAAGAAVLLVLLLPLLGNAGIYLTKARVTAIISDVASAICVLLLLRSFDNSVNVAYIELLRQSLV